MTTQVQVARDLKAILDMATRLPERAVDLQAGSLLGGEALVNLAGVGSMATWNARQEAREELGDYDTSAEDPDDLWPAVQMLAFWSEDFRRQLGMDHDGWRPTLVSEAKFLRNHDVAEWIWSNELHWDDYAGDVAKARAKLENVLIEGERAELGAPCLYEECHGARLARRLEPHRDDEGEKAWRWTKWACPRNRNHAWTEDEYARMVTAAHERTKFEDIDGTEWCALDYAARKVDRSVKTIRTWVNREELATLCLIAGRRLPFVSLEEVRELAEGRARRKRAS